MWLRCVQAQHACGARCARLLLMGVHIAKCSVSNFGRIRSNRRSVAYYPKPASSGHPCLFGLKTGLRVPVHVLVHVLHNDPMLLWRQDGDSIDHIDRDRLNNCRRNLRWANKWQQVANRNPLKKSGLNSVPVTLTKDGESVFYASSKAAAEALGIDRGYLSRRHGKLCKGWKVEKHDSVSLPGEVWRLHSDGLNVSNRGRIQMLAQYGQRMYEPEPREDGYKRVQIPSLKSHKNVGHVVLEAFGFPQPSPTHTVNHLDHDRGNNKIENLEWQTKAGQVAHQRQPKKHGVRRRVEFRLSSTGETANAWSVADDISDASVATGCAYRCINNCLYPGHRQKRTPGTGGLQYEFRWMSDAEFDDLPGEVWKPIVVADWDKGGKYHVCGIGVCCAGSSKLESI